MQSLNLQPRGLFTHPNPLSEVPPGALIKAKNMIMDKEGVIETRRGFKQYGNALSLSAGQKINALFNFDETLLVHYGTTLAYDSNGAGNWTPYSGSFSPPSGAIAIHSLEANKNFYFSTASGIYKLDSASGTPAAAGGIKALDGTYGLSSAGSGFFANNNQIAYRVVWGIVDANDNLILGAPSQRIIAINTSGSDDTVALTFTIPASITTSYFYQVYRSVLSGGSAIVPNDELGLVYENNPTAGEITAKAITFTDSVPDSLRGATLYTSPSQQGIAQANDAPPLCKDMAFYKNATLYANTTSKQRLTITMISVGGAIGVAVNDTITINGVLFTAKGSENAAAGEFKVTTTGTPAENIDATAQSFVRVINKYASNTTVYAYYLSGYNDLPGKILLEERSIGGAAFPIIGSNGGAFNPVLPTSGTTISSSNEATVNRIYISKDSQSEAVPLLNYLLVGSANKEILRIIALRASVFVFKEDGVFRITGEDITSYRVALFDSTVILTAPETAVAFSNEIYAYTSQGVVAISDTGSAIQSRPIESDLLPVATYTNFDSLSFGVAYNSDRKFIFFTSKTSSDTYPKKAWVFNSICTAWTWWERNFSCGIVNVGDDKLYFGAADSAYVYQERKTFTVADYADEEISITITGHSGTTVNLSSTAGIAAGWTLIKGSKISTVISITNSTALVVEDSLEWTPGGGTAYNPIHAEVETVPQTAGNPGVLKQYRDMTMFFRRANFRQIMIGFKSNISAYLQTESVSPIVEAAWGNFPWGQFAWGGNTPDLQVIRTYLPRNKQRAHWVSVNVTHAVARDYFAIAGLSLQYEAQSERVK